MLGSFCQSRGRCDGLPVVSFHVSLDLDSHTRLVDAAILLMPLCDRIRGFLLCG